MDSPSYSVEERVIIYAHDTVAQIEPESIEVPKSDNDIGGTTMRRHWSSNNVAPTDTADDQNQKSRKGFFNWLTNRNAKAPAKQRLGSNGGHYTKNTADTKQNRTSNPGNLQEIQHNVGYHREGEMTNGDMHESFVRNHGEVVPYYIDNIPQHSASRRASGQGNLVYPSPENCHHQSNISDTNRHHYGVFARYMDCRRLNDNDNTMAYRNVEQMAVSTPGDHYHTQRQEQRVINMGLVDDPWTPLPQRSLQPGRTPTTRSHTNVATPNSSTEGQHPRLPTYEESAQAAELQNNEKQDLNLRFYNNEIKFMPDGDSILQIHDNWFGNFKLLEQNRMYMHWLFPIPEGDPKNPWAQPLQDHEARAIWGDKTLRHRVKMSYNMMLNMFGMILKDQRTGDIGRTKDWRTRYDQLLRSPDSKHRITRIIRSLGALGLADYQTPFVLFLLHEVIATKSLFPFSQDECVDDWIASISDLNERTTTRDFYDQYKNASSMSAGVYRQSSMSDNDIPGSVPNPLANTETPSLLHTGYINAVMQT